MKMREVILRAIARKITWGQAAEILGISDSAMERLRRLYMRRGYDGLWVRGIHKPHQKNIPLATVEQVLLLYQQKYFHLSMRSACEELRKKHGIDVSYKWMAKALHEAGLVANSRDRQLHS